MSVLKSHEPAWLGQTVKTLQNPWMILLSIIAGIWVGVFYKPFALAVGPIGDLYLLLLKMCVIPLILSAITLSIAKMLMNREARQHTGKILIVFPAFLLVVSLIAALMGEIGQPGAHLSTATLETLGGIVNSQHNEVEVSLSGPIPPDTSGPRLLEFFYSMVPGNIFDALTKGDTLKIITFAIIFGIALAVVPSPNSVAILKGLEALYDAFREVIRWLTIIVPIALFAILAHQFAVTGFDVLLAMTRFVVVNLITFALIYALGTAILVVRSKRSLVDVMKAQSEVTILALSTRSSFACLPASITAMVDGLKFDSETVDLLMPLTITICRFGSIIYFAIAALFVAQLYNVDIGISGVVTIVIASVFAGIATSGSGGIVTLTLLAIVLDPLRLPLDAVLVLLIAVDPLIEPFRTLAITQTSMALVATISTRQSERPLPGFATAGVDPAVPVAR